MIMIENFHYYLDLFVYDKYFCSLWLMKIIIAMYLAIIGRKKGFSLIGFIMIPLDFENRSKSKHIKLYLILLGLILSLNSLFEINKSLLKFLFFYLLVTLILQYIAFDDEVSDYNISDFDPTDDDHVGHLKEIMKLEMYKYQKLTIILKNTESCIDQSILINELYSLNKKLEDLSGEINQIMNDNKVGCQTIRIAYEESRLKYSLNVDRYSGFKYKIAMSDKLSTVAVSKKLLNLVKENKFNNYSTQICNIWLDCFLKNHYARPTNLDIRDEYVDISFDIYNCNKSFVGDCYHEIYPIKLYKTYYYRVVGFKNPFNHVSFYSFKGSKRIYGFQLLSKTCMGFYKKDLRTIRPESSSNKHLSPLNFEDRMKEVELFLEDRPDSNNKMRLYNYMSAAVSWYHGKSYKIKKVNLEYKIRWKNHIDWILSSPIESSHHSIMSKENLDILKNDKSREIAHVAIEASAKNKKGGMFKKVLQKKDNFVKPYGAIIDAYDEYKVTNVDIKTEEVLKESVHRSKGHCVVLTNGHFMSNCKDCEKKHVFKQPMGSRNYFRKNYKINEVVKNNPHQTEKKMTEDWTIVTKTTTIKDEYKIKPNLDQNYFSVLRGVSFKHPANMDVGISSDFDYTEKQISDYSDTNSTQRKSKKISKQKEAKRKVRGLECKSYKVYVNGVSTVKKVFSPKQEMSVKPIDEEIHKFLGFKNKKQVNQMAKEFAERRANNKLWLSDLFILPRASVRPKMKDEVSKVVLSAVRECIFEDDGDILRIFDGIDFEDLLDDNI